MPGSAHRRSSSTGKAERELVAASQGGDREAFGVLYARYSGSVFGYSLRILRDPDAAEDVRQEAFLRAWRGLESFDVSRELWPWLQTITHRLCIDELRRRRSRRESPLSEAEPDVAHESPEAPAAFAEAFSALPSRHRQLLLLQAIEGRSYSEIARAEGSSVTAVAKALARARERVRLTMERAGRALGLIPAWIAIRDRGKRLATRLGGRADLARLNADSTVLSASLGAVLVGLAVACGVILWSFNASDPQSSGTERSRPSPPASATSVAPPSSRAGYLVSPGVARSPEHSGTTTRLSPGETLLAEVHTSPARPGGAAPSSQSAVVEVRDPQGNLLLREEVESDCGGQGGQVIPPNGLISVVC
jgi:RNA polymerase sigma-70 factor (ECF subfamily)